MNQPGFVRTKLSDLTAMVGLFLALVLTIALTALGNSGVMKQVLEWFGLQDVPGVSLALRVASLAISVLITWLLFTWIIARLPRESVSFRSAMRAGLIAAVAFEIFKQVASIYLRRGDRPGRSDVRSGAWSDGVRLHHFSAHPVRDRVGRDVERQALRPHRSTRPIAAQITPRVSFREGFGVRGALAAVSGGCRWCAGPFAVDAPS